MTFVAKSITGKIDLDGNPSIESIKAVANASGKLKQTVETNVRQAAEGMSATFKNQLVDLKAQFGKSSLLGQGLKLAAGGGAIMAFTIATDKISEAIKGAADLKQQFAEGKANAFDVGENVAKMIPILGQAYELGRNIRAAWTGEAAELAETASRVKEQADGWDRVQASIKESKAAAGAFGDEIRNAVEELARLKAGSGPGLQSVVIEQEKGASLRANGNIFDPKESADKIAAVQKRLADLNGQLAMKDHEIQTLQADKPVGFNPLGSGADAQVQQAQEERRKVTEQRTQALQELQKLQDSDKTLRQKQADGKVAIEAVAAEKIKKLQADSVAAVQQNNSEIMRLHQQSVDLANAPAMDAQKQLDQMRMTDSQKKLDDMKRAGSSDDDIKKSAEIFKNLDGAKAAEKLKEAANALHESLETPAEKMRQTLAKYKEMLTSKLISQEDYDRATLQVSQDSVGAGAVSNKTASLVRAGSAESQAARFGSKYDKNAVLESLAKQQLAKLDVIAGHAQTLAGHATEQPDTVHDMAGIA